MKIYMTNMRMRSMLSIPILFAMCWGSPAFAETGDLELLLYEVRDHGQCGYWDVDLISLSEDGQLVAFGSRIHTIFPSGHVMADAVVVDWNARTTERASRHTDGTRGNANSRDPSMSQDGNRVVFLSDATNLTDDDSNGITDLFLHDRAAGTTVRITPDPAPDEADNYLHHLHRPGQLSANGNRLVFSSWMDSLSVDDSNGREDVYVYDVPSGSLELVSQTTSGQTGAGRSGFEGLAISPDGNWVAFASRAPDIVSGVAPARDLIYLRNLTTGDVQLVSRRADGSVSDEAWGASISENGKYVVFSSEDPGMVPGMMNGTCQVILRDMTDGTNEVVSLNDAGDPANDCSHIYDYVDDGRISNDGRFVAFASDATNLGGGGAPGALYVRDRTLGRTTLVSVGSDGVPRNVNTYSISGDGRYVGFTSWTDFGLYGSLDNCADYPLLYDLGPTDPAERIDELVNSIIDLNLQEGIANSLDAKLDSALGALADSNLNNDDAACNSLDALLNAVDAQDGNKIDSGDAQTIRDRVDATMAELGCL
jgi:Tol biopolymer transport system component